MNHRNTGFDGTNHDEKLTLYLNTLKDKNPALRCCAAQFLGRTRSEKALESLIRALGDEDLWVRKNVIEALGRIQNEKALPYLEKLKNDNTRSIWSYKTLGEVARESIEKIKKETGGENSYQDFRQLFRET